MRRSLLFSMIIRCSRVDPERHPEESTNTGCSSSGRVSSEIQRSASSSRAGRSPASRLVWAARSQVYLGPIVARTMFFRKLAYFHLSRSSTTAMKLRSYEVAENRSWARILPARPMDARSEGFSPRRSSSVPKTCGVIQLEKKPRLMPSMMVSGSPVQLETTAGRPHADPSITEIPSPSSEDASTLISNTC